nr:MAG TPA: hypothetical protein [Caudoviricetes sp.]
MIRIPIRYNLHRVRVNSSNSILSILGHLILTIVKIGAKHGHY